MVGRTSSVPKVYYSFLARCAPIRNYLCLSHGRQASPIEDVLERRPRNVFERESHHTSFEDALEAEMGEQAIMTKLERMVTMRAT